MSLTLSSKWTEKTVLKENWLFQLFYDDESATDFFGISYYDTTVESVNYRGCVLNKATIRESINLETSTAKTSNVSVTLANFIDGNGTHFSRQLLNGTNKYINRTVKIYIQPDDDVDIADCVQIYNGRLEQISHTVDKINLSIVAKRVWDKISIPTLKTSSSDNDNIYFPVAYGDYTGNSEGITTGKDLRPIPFVQTMHDGKVFASSIESSTGDAHVHVYNRNKDAFLRANETSSNNINKLGGFVTELRDNGKRYMNIHPFEARDSDSGSPFNGESGVATFNNEEKAIDGNSGTYATESFSVSGGSGDTDITYMYFNMPKLDFGSIVDDTTSMRIFITYKIENFTNSGNVKLFGKFEGDSPGVNDNADAVLFATHTANTSDTQEDVRVFVDTSSFPQYILIKVKANEDSVGGQTFSCDLSISDVFLRVLFKDSDETFKDINMAYTGEDGLKDNGWNSNADITEIHEAHRDLLTRFTSYSGTPTNWSSGLNINSVRNWKIRYWILESTPLINILERLAFEGGFIGRFNGQGDFQYIFIPNSPSASETLNSSDIADLDISSTPVNSLTTKMQIEYEKHPAEDKYINSATSASANDATLLSNFNIASNENQKTIKLDAYVSPTIPTSPSSNKNDDFYSYYDHILGKPRIIISFTVVNTKYLGLDVGDIIAINFNSVVLPFAGSTGWDDYKFMITDLQRSAGSLKITAREI
tara:strand:+ start:1569 stop:3689 length:2121 start_codon:yes stop_codon:yes gene_type:complete